ncbi:acetamidase/formamidase family protein [Clostridium sp. Marseille-P2415]|uniref:acetamidase/formamidase family protein n=1 Tax=Clostridium sp. Marseille-P2415 TaxID=1805471 RepID=UPI0009888ED2|nr:acetamidase/formamidase family protein [Clostridium sp. Marseille-P2415]
MKIITRNYITNILSRDNRPCDRIKAGETVAFETYDCFTNQFLPEDATFENVVRKPGNPATGPLYIEDAMPGDMLKIDILDIEMGPAGIVMLGPDSGSEKEEFPKKVLKRVPVKGGFAFYNEKVPIPVKPMIGVIGVAPAGEGVSTITPMDHGGNMDCTQIKKGATLYLPVFVEGALLSMGDFHAVMGDGEVEDCGLEIEGRATIRVNVVRNKNCVPYPMIETEDKLITIASREHVEEAWRAAARQMYDFMKGKIGMDYEDAGMLLTMTGDLVICQTVNPMKTVRMELPRHITQSYGFNSISVE